ncbi:hypothetical protein HDV62DRAFT_403571 [Trichoderma sp. SZMC 28011]
MDSPNDSRGQCRPLTDGSSDSEADEPQDSQGALSTENSISELADECRQSLQACIQVETLMEYEWAENSLANFRLWAAGLGVFADKDSLDERLSVDPFTRNVVKSLLILLKGLIDNCKAIASGQDIPADDFHEDDFHEDDFHEESTQDGQSAIPQSPPRGFSPWSTPSPTNSESETGSDDPLVNTSPLQSSKEEVEHILKQLSRLDVVILKSDSAGSASRNQKADQLFKREDHEDLYKHLTVVVLGRGGQDGPQSYDIDPALLTPIQERLILSNLRRRNRFQYAQIHYKKLAVDTFSRQREVLGSQSTQDKTDQSSTILATTSVSAFEPTTPEDFQRKPGSSQLAKTKVTLTTAGIEYFPACFIREYIGRSI